MFFNKIIAGADLINLAKNLPEMLDLLPIKIFIKDENSKFIFANKTQLNFMGLSSREEAIGKSDYDFLTKEVADRTRLDEKNILDTGEFLLEKKEPIKKINGATIQGITNKYRYIDESGNKIVVGFSADITAQCLREEELQKLAREDALTGIFNRLGFMEFLDHSIKRARRDKEAMTLLYFDLDDFKQINDRYGHAVGDFYLQGFVQRLKKCLRDTDIVGRLGGDEFVVILQKANVRETVSFVCNKIKEELINNPLKVGQNVIPIKASIGARIYPIDEYITPDDLIKQADAAMYEAKTKKVMASQINIVFYDDLKMLTPE